MLCVPPENVFVLGGNEKRLTVLCMVATTLPTISIFHLHATIERVSFNYCYSLS